MCVESLRGLYTATGESRAAAEDRQTVELGSHVLSLREGELQTCVADKDKLIAMLESSCR
jgi:hypothetical protein